MMNAYKNIQKEFRQPGHKKEMKAFNNERRGTRIPSVRVVETKIRKDRRRENVKKYTRRAVAETFC